MASGAQLINYIQLNWTDEDGIVTVTPKDENRFSIKLSRAIAVLQRADREEQFSKQFSLLLGLLVKWLKDRQDVGNAYLTLRDGGLFFLVVRQAAEYDERFEDELSELDLSLAKDVDLDLVKLDVMALPPVSETALSSFLDPTFTICIPPHGSGSGPHRAGE